MEAPDHYATYRESMPASYLAAFDERAVREHADIVVKRAGRPAHAEIWKILPRELAVVLIVAADFPGLLSTITTAFVLHRLNITTAQVHSRRTAKGELEAVDLFWLRRRDHGRRDHRAPTRDELESSLRTLVGFVGANRDALEFLAPASASAFTEHETRAYFDPEDQNTLVVEAQDAAGLVMQIARTLYHLNVAIVTSDIRTEGTLAKDRFTVVSQAHRALSEDERQRVCAVLVTTLESWREQSLLQLGT